MSPHLEKLLLAKYSSLFNGRRGGTRHIGVGDGWYNLIDTLCALICWEHGPEKGHRSTKHVDSDTPMSHELDERGAVDGAQASTTVTEFVNSLPVVNQVKEKFGGLRFYADGCNETIDNYITFAECLSARTCEVCGAPGERRDDGGWLRTLCDQHTSDRKASR
jgi:hypothetical protein